MCPRKNTALFVVSISATFFWLVFVTRLSVVSFFFGFCLVVSDFCVILCACSSCCQRWRGFVSACRERTRQFELRRLNKATILSVNESVGPRAPQIPSEVEIETSLVPLNRAFTPVPTSGWLFHDLHFRSFGTLVPWKLWFQINYTYHHGIILYEKMYWKKME